MPFSKQFFHLRDMQKSGKSSQFGSFKYSAQELYDKGILLSMDQYSPRQFDRINIVISSNVIGVFTMEVYNTSMGTSTLIASTDLRMEDLLQAQFENQVSLALFDGMVKVNLNLLLYQINKKYVPPPFAFIYADPLQVLRLISFTVSSSSISFDFLHRHHHDTHTIIPACVTRPHLCICPGQLME